MAENAPLPKPLSKCTVQILYNTKIVKKNKFSLPLFFLNREESNFFHFSEMAAQY
jgi:hypothetical protein